MSSLPPLEKYRVREVDIDGKTWPIVLHGRGGSTILVALANAVLHSWDFRKAFKTEGGARGRPKYVRTEVLFQIIEMAIVDNLDVRRQKGLIDLDGMLVSWNICRLIIRLLHTECIADPVFTSCKEFGNPILDHLFSALGIGLYHCFVIDPEDYETANAVGSKSLAKIQEILKSSPAEVDENAAFLMKKLVENTKVRLTSYGLTCLKDSIGTGQCGVLMRHDGYSLVRRMNGVLYTLLATEEQLKKYPDALWQSLEEVKDDGMLLTKNGVHVEKQAVITDAEKAIALERQEAIIQDEAREKLKLSKPSSKQRKRAAKKAADEKKAEQELEGSIPSEVEQDRLEQKEQEVEHEETEEERDDDMCESFSCFLRKFEDVNTTKPFYVGQVKALDYCNALKLTINFNHLDSYDTDTSRYICNNMPRVSERLTQCVIEFLLEHEEFKNKFAEVFQMTEIEISNLPPPNSVQSFSEFAMVNDMYKLWELYDCGDKRVVSATTYVGRQAALGYLRFILKNHNARKCWNGFFEMEDLVVLIHGDGSMEFVITTEASDDFSTEKAVPDFNKFCVLLFPYFHKVDVLPAYFDEFQYDYLLHMPNRDNTVQYDRWQRYMSNHFAFKAPQSCTDLITETYEIFDSGRVDATPLASRGDLSDWTKKVKSSGSCSLIETYDYGAQTSENRYNEVSYWKLLMYGRHYSHHMLSAKDKGKIIKLKDLSIVHLMLAHILNGEMVKIIRYIMLKVNGYSGELFSTAWRHFMASETFDDDLDNMPLDEDMKEVSLDSAAVTKVSPGDDSKAPPVDKCDGATASSEVVSQG